MPSSLHFFLRQTKKNHKQNEENKIGTSKIKFLIGIHNHQPVGNFGHVFEECFELGYRPFIDTLAKFPGVKISIHYTGPLFEWIEKNRPEFLDKINAMVESKQIEMLGGGFYEPLLSTIPFDDAVGQIKMQTEYIKKRFNYDVSGIWLAERVWDPYIPVILKKAGIKYTILDDTHFFCTGMSEKDMFGYYNTERHGQLASVFPINKFLRYSMPFKLPEETFDYFKAMKEKYNAECMIFADDGEKFGIWPGTQKWVYEEKWLEKFFTLIEKNSDWVETITFNDYMNTYKSSGNVYLPMASYEEMMEWALPEAASQKFKNSIESIKHSGNYEDLKPFIRGGIWDNFFVKYPESNKLHKKALWVSKRIEKLPVKLKEKAQKELYKGQCNCAYWHGLFGGLYLNYLRHSLYKHTIMAEKIVDNFENKDNIENFVNFCEYDINIDGDNEVIVSTSYLTTTFDPNYGGSILELDYKPKEFNITDVISRKKETYHKDILADDNNKNNSSEPQSIHDIKNVKEEGLEKLLCYDQFLKNTFLDHFLSQDTTFETFKNSKYTDISDFTNSRYEYKINQAKQTLTLKRDGFIFHENSNEPLSVEKIFTFSKNRPSIKAGYKITNNSNKELKLWFAIEFNFTLLAGESEDRYFYNTSSKTLKSKLRTDATYDSIKGFVMKDEFNSFEIELNFKDLAPSLWYFPVETVSQSESGIERTYQGSNILSQYRIKLKPGEEKELKLELNINET